MISGLKKWLWKIVRTEKFRKITAFLALMFMILTFVISLDPRPFLNLGYFGIFVFSIFGSGIFLVPVISRYLNVFVIAFIVSLGMAINDLVSWYLGKRGDIVFPRSKRVIRAEKTLHKYGPYGLLFFSFIPLPYDFFGVIAGYMEFPFWRFVIPTFLGRFLRFLILGTGSIAIFGFA